jgi:hypothetical protein
MRLQVKIECGEDSVSSLREELLRAQEMYLVAKIDHLSKWKADPAAKIAMLNSKGILAQLHLTKRRCEQVIKCTENAIELMEIEHPDIVAESRHAYEEIMVKVNQPIERVVTKLLAAPNVGNIFANGARSLEVPCSSIRLRARDWTHCSAAHLSGHQDINKQDE